MLTIYLKKSLECIEQSPDVMEVVDIKEYPSYPIQMGAMAIIVP